MALATLLLFLSLTLGLTSGLRLAEHTAFLEHNHQRLVVVRQAWDECDLYGGDIDLRLRDHAKFNAMFNITLVSTPVMSDIVRQCQDLHQELLNSHDTWDRKDTDLDSSSQDNGIESSLWRWNLFNRLLIMPGTKWCGQGSVAEHYQDLGYHAEVDKCCRSHDLCLEVTGEYLSPGQCKNGLCNLSPFTRSPCSCDRKLASCLKQTNNRISDAVGRMFFNIAGMSCYALEHPVTGCDEYIIPPPNHVPAWILAATKVNPDPRRPRCKRYQVDRSRPKRWQFFQLIYDESHTNTGPRASRTLGGGHAKYADRRERKPMPVLQQFLVDLFLKVVNV